tara:strand:+ start:1804 stop:2775 length:972 start_codon:yes stop_codon:yes gene_type:complete
MLLSMDDTLSAQGASKHVPVLLEATMEYLNPEKGGIFLDGTFGGGGHTREMLESSPEVCVVAIDRDPEAEERSLALKEIYGDRFRFYSMNFADIGRVEERSFDGILFDFGLSSFQLDEGERGFSFRFDAPLDMRMNNQEGITASEFLESASEADLVRAIRDYGEERSWRKVVAAILGARGKGVLGRTKSFAELVELVIPRRAGFKDRIHPATRTFQGVRIAINKELESIEAGLEEGFRRLKVNGVMVAISFHSLEDRIVKRFFRKLSGRPEHRKDGRLQEERQVLGSMIETKAVKASEEEILENARSRSARMRGIKKLVEEVA